MTEVDVLAVFAHPDDLELSVGGTMLKLKALGYRTGALDVTRGEMGTRGTVEGRAEEAKKAAEILKLDIRENLGLRDGHVFIDEASRIAMTRAFRRHKPRVVITHQIGDSHPDHNNIAQLVRECSRLCAMSNFDAETGGERIKPPIVAHNIFSRSVHPSFIVDISEHLDGKIAAIRAHASQFFDPNSNEPETMLTGETYIDEIEYRSRYYGSLIGTAAGEPFFVREALNIEDPFALLTRSMNLYS
ncbi:MAG: bacillithiol biosynthesis deacetylase BshB1 [Acidobacteriota bacterium]|nr:MAG: bacillithiol biosynthesis deacetylase BshB1 [Acidobacteriota bacterium]